MIIRDGVLVQVRTTDIYNGKVTIPDGVTSIGNWAFRLCTKAWAFKPPRFGLTAVSIPESVTSIGDYAFYDCMALTHITLPDGLTSIGNWAFNGCISLVDTIIPESVTSMGKGVFDHCPGNQISGDTEGAEKQ